MSKDNDTFKVVYDQSRKLEQPIQAMRHYIDSIPDETSNHSLLSILTEKLEAEFIKLQQISLDSISK